MTPNGPPADALRGGGNSFAARFDINTSFP